jgi:hypothetical protein
VSASWVYDDEPRGGHPLQPGAAPRDIRAHLLAEDRAEFDADYQQAVDEAKSSLDLTGLFKTLEHWRRRALLQSDPADFRRVVRRAAELITGQEVPDDEPLSVTRARVGM